MVALALLPVSAYGADSSTATTDTQTAVPATTTSTQASAGALPQFTISSLVTRMSVERLITKRAAALRLPSALGEIALNEDGSTLWAHNPELQLMPASTMKIVTTTVALEHLGANWRPHTTVRFDTATSTLALVGGGDPQLTKAQLTTLARQAVDTLTAQGLTPSRIVIDDSLFPTPTLQPGVPASWIPVEERPVRALVVDGQRVPDSGLAAGKVFRTILAGMGVHAPFAGREVSAGETIASIAGYTLRSAIQHMLLVSDNDTAEMLFRLSALAPGRTASWADARTTALETLASLGVDTATVRLVDGSGLSHNNRLTAATLAQLLHLDLARPRTAILPTLLPRAGRTGTLWYRYTTAPSKCVRGRLYAKTGSLEQVVTLAGYAPAPQGRWRPFAILVNGVQPNEYVRWKTRLAIDTVAAAIGGC